VLQKRLNRSCAVKAPGPGLGLGPGGVSVSRAAVQLAGVPSGRSPERSCLPGLGGVSERGQGSEVVKGRSL
jgi:hypothetical protein